ncbi:MAG: hypothetical protein WCR72_11065 [Bacteroidota bacterium]
MELVNAQHLMQMNPGGFNAPTEQQVTNMAGPADSDGNLITPFYAQVCLSGERFWLKILYRSSFSGIYQGIVDNDLVGTVEHGIKLGDQLHACWFNFYKIMPAGNNFKPN